MAGVRSGKRPPAYLASLSKRHGATRGSSSLSIRRALWSHNPLSLAFSSAANVGSVGKAFYSGCLTASASAPTASSASRRRRPDPGAGQRGRMPVFGPSWRSGPRAPAPGWYRPPRNREPADRGRSAVAACANLARRHDQERGQQAVSAGAPRCVRYDRTQQIKGVERVT